MTIDGFDARATHERFVTLAGKFSPTLAADLAAVGPIDWPEPRKGSVGLFLSRAVVGQQLSTVAARTIWTRIEALARDSGEAVPLIFRPAKAEALRACGVSGAKVRALLAIREADQAGALAEEALRVLPAEERNRRLLAIRGVGPWTCDMASIFHFGDPDVWPEGDVAVSKTFARYIGRRKPARTAARFAPERSFLALYMWRIIDRMP